ncbi:MAG: BamA/TamA family outer membrane protein, partial [Acidobacteriota bacterium]
EANQPVVEIAAGDRRHLASVTVTGAPDSEAEAIRALIPLDAGDPLLAAELASATLAIERHLRQQGWNRAGVRVEVEPNGTRMAVEVQIEPGPRQRLVAVEVAGDPVTETRWVERLAGLETGGWLDAEAISKARRNLLGTGLFERVGVDVVEDPDSEADARVRFTLDERPRYQVSYGARWESDDGLGAVVDLFDRNVGGRGFGLGVRGQWVSDDAALRVYANHPRVFNSPISLDLFVEAFEEVDQGLDAEGWETSAQLSWAVRPDTRLRTYVRYRRADVVDTRLRTADRRKQRESTPVAGLQIYYDGRDDPLDPRRGLFTSFDLSGSENLLSGDDSYLRAFGQIDLHLPIPRTGGRLTWSQGLSVGHAEVYQGQLPRDERFFAGGSRSVRGYDSRSLGPVIVLPIDGERRALGGDTSLVLNQELRFELSPTLTGIAFFDAGRVEADFEGLLDRFDIDDDDELRRSIGVGVRFRSPVGLLRLDLAHPLDAREQDNDIAVYIGFGHAF